MSVSIVTCGPASTRIDAVRRITNASTGELGSLLADELRLLGDKVFLLRGEGATYPAPNGMEVRSFYSNEDLLGLFREIAGKHSVTRVFHAAALMDFSVSSVTDSCGTILMQNKIRSDTSDLTIRLQPASKVIRELRALFPKTYIVGWKYELEGTTDDVLEKGRRQMAECQTDACVLNGAAVTGFIYLTSESQFAFRDKKSLAEFLTATTSGQ